MASLPAPRKRKQAPSAAAALSYLPGFKVPTSACIADALGDFGEASAGGGGKAKGDKAGSGAHPAARSHAVAHYSHGDLFARIPPRPVDDRDWLCNNDERQTFADYVTMMCERRAPFALKRSVRASRRVICLLPVGDMSRSCVPDIVNVVASFVSSFYACRVRVLAPIGIANDPESDKRVLWKDAALLRESAVAEFDNGVAVALRRSSAAAAASSAKAALVVDDDADHGPAMIKSRAHLASGRRQLHVEPILSKLAAQLESRAFETAHGDDVACIMGVTLEDLYSHHTDLFVAGMATGGSHVAIFSLYRYQPKFVQSDEHWFEHSFVGEAQPAAASSSSSSRKQARAQSAPPVAAPADRHLFLKRACRLMAHELGHLLGLDHCIWHQCLMNGSGHLAQDDTQPLHACPVDLRKLQVRLGMDPPTHYRAMIAWYSQQGRADDAVQCAHGGAGPAASGATPSATASLIRDAFSEELAFCVACLERIT